MRRLSKSCMPIGSFMLQSYTFSLILPLIIVKKIYKITKNGVMQSIMTPFLSFFNHESTRISANAYNRYSVLFQPQIYTDFHEYIPEGIIRANSWKFVVNHYCSLRQYELLRCSSLTTNPHEFSRMHTGKA